MAWDNPYQIKKARLLKEKRTFLTRHATPSYKPNLFGIPHAIASYASELGGVIAGGTALKFYSPNMRTSDVDIITRGNRHVFAKMLVNRLKRDYGERFRIIPANKAVRIFDTKDRKYVADIVNFPLSEKNVVQVSNFKIASPEHVFSGKIKAIDDKQNAFVSKIRRFL